jgi:hypothetical protein
MTINGNTENTDKPTVTPYADTAYTGKANPYFRENIAPPEQRSRHLAKGQCQMGVFPRVSITGICWDNRQAGYNSSSTKEIQQDTDKKLKIKDADLRLALHSLSQNTKEAALIVWMYIHLGGMVLLPLYLLIGLVLNGWADLVDNLDVLALGLGVLLVSKYLYRLLDKFSLIPTGQYVIFNRQNGMVEIANDERTGYHHLPFEEFNAHHRTVHSQRGAPSYGFTLLHYTQDLMYQIADYPSVESVLTHWELIKNFMDTTQPLADIPQFEKYRAYDSTTIAYDKKHGRPSDFWCRVSKKFMKKVSSQAFDVVYKFPSKEADTLHEAKQHGYKVPDTVRFPWKEAESISDEFVVIKPNVFFRYIIRPLLF